MRALAALPLIAIGAGCEWYFPREDDRDAFVDPCGRGCDAGVFPDAQVIRSWPQVIGTSGQDWATSLDVAPDGETTVGAAVASSGPETPPAAFVARYDANGFQLWSRTWAGESGPDHSQVTSAVADDRAGGSYACGRFTGSIDLDGTPYASNGLQDLWIAKLDRTGQVVWRHAIGGAGWLDECLDLAATPAGDVVAVGTHHGASDFGAGAVGVEGETAAYAAMFEGETGELVWLTRVVPASGEIAFTDVAVSPIGDVVLAGRVQGEATVGEWTVRSDGFGDVLLAAAALSDGVIRWVRLDGDVNHETAAGVAVDGDGSIYVTGLFSGTTRFGSGMITATGEEDAFVASFDSEGLYRWSRAIGGAQWDEGRDIAVDGGGDVIVAVTFRSPLVVGTSSLSPVGDNDAAWAWLRSADGFPLRAAQLGGPSTDEANAVAVRPGGTTALGAGSFEGSASIAGGTIFGAGSWDAFVVVVPN